MVSGWLLSALAGVLALRRNVGRRIVPFRNAESHRLDWHVTGPYFFGLLLAVIGGAGLERRAFGMWAVPLAIVPLFLAYILPVLRHNIRARGASVG